MSRLRTRVCVCFGPSGERKDPEASGGSIQANWYWYLIALCSEMDTLDRYVEFVDINSTEHIHFVFLVQSLYYFFYTGKQNE